MSITRFIALRLANYRSDKSPAFHFRQKRAIRLRQLISDYYKKYGKVTLIDIGGTRLYWQIIPDSFLRAHQVSITIVNLPSHKPLPVNDEVFDFLEGDGCQLTAFQDHIFNIAHSNSVIEHVGSDSKRIKFADELRRVAKSYFLQTPNYWFPFEPHFFCPFFQWLPKTLKMYLVMHYDMGWFRKANSPEEAVEIINSCNLLRKKELKKLFPEATIYKEKFMFLTKSFMVIKACC
ncbi:MAG: hypothetical protein JXB49_32690 [Bacteroidales bacterium]|nr:hypothetical protein [Bacteroidales bacterium]